MKNGEIFESLGLFSVVEVIAKFETSGPYICYNLTFLFNALSFKNLFTFNFGFYQLPLSF